MTGAAVSIQVARKARSASQASALTRGPAWAAGCIRDDHDRIIPNLANALTALRKAPETADAFAFDEMQQAAILRRELPAAPGGSPAGGPFPRPVRDGDVSQAQEWLQHAGLPKIAREVVHQAVDQVAEERRFHPVRQYLDGLVWDRCPRLASWLSTCLGAEANTYVSGIGELFLIAMVARIYKPGCKADYMLVLEGEQGIGKSRACRALAGAWFSDALPDIHAKDASQHLRGKWLIEVAELSAIGKADAEALKAFITRSEERYRPPYGRKEVIEPRQCVFVGSTNKAEYLKDETGARRFWPVHVGHIDIAALKRDRDQLLAEAVSRLEAGAKWWPDGSFEREHIQPEQAKRFEADAWDEIIRSHCACFQRVSVMEVATEALSLERKQVGTSEQRRISAVLVGMGWKPAKSNGARFYQKPMS